MELYLVVMDAELNSASNAELLQIAYAAYFCKFRENTS
jgi:hypothetical protein